MMVVMVVVMMVVVVVPPVRRHDYDSAAVGVVMMVVVMMILRELHIGLALRRALLFIDRLQQRSRIRDGRKQVRIGVDLQDVRSRGRSRSLR